ncbi:MAG: hypothetical protein H6559_01240 [Lewinellaceae bacterium]|nr:hypothetical protein [Lewinellaceae bacterium]
MLYPDFLKDYTAYQEVERFWESLFTRIAEQNGWAWRSWMKPAFANGTPFFDGNPIFNAFVPELNRGVRILQVEPEESDEFSFYQDVVEMEDGHTFPELVISLILTEETKEQAETAIVHWLKGGEINRTYA